MFTHLTDPQHWRSRAEEMRTLGERSRDTGTKRTLLKIAVDYDTMAERAAQRQAEVGRPGNGSAASRRGQ